jgi:RNA polymerase sigma-70 factor (ECF subfamily)
VPGFTVGEVNLPGSLRRVGDVIVSERTPTVVVEGFDAFYRREYRSIRALGWALTGDLGAAEEIAQEAFLRAHVRWDKVSAYDEPGAWVRRVAINLATSVLRRRTRELRAVMRLQARPRDTWDLPAADHEFWVAVRALPRGQAATIALHYYEDLPVSEIAAVLGIAEGTVKAHLHKGRRNLAKRLGTLGGLA